MRQQVLFVRNRRRWACSLRRRSGSARSDADGVGALGNRLSLKEDDYAVDNPELHRYAFWFRNHDVYRYSLIDEPVRATVRGGPFFMVFP